MKKWNCQDFEIEPFNSGHRLGKTLRTFLALIVKMLSFEDFYFGIVQFKMYLI